LFFLNKNYFRIEEINQYHGSLNNGHPGDSLLFNVAIYRECKSVNAFLKVSAINSYFCTADYKFQEKPFYV